MGSEMCIRDRTTVGPDEGAGKRGVNAEHNVEGEDSFVYMINPLHSYGDSNCIADHTPQPYYVYIGTLCCIADLLTLHRQAADSSPAMLTDIDAWLLRIWRAYSLLSTFVSSYKSPESHQTRASLTTHHLTHSQPDPVRLPTPASLNLETLHTPFIPTTPRQVGSGGGGRLEQAHRQAVRYADTSESTAILCSSNSL